MSSAPTKVPGLIGSYGKAALAALPLAGKLPLLPGGGGPLPSGTSMSMRQYRPCVSFPETRIV